MLKTIFLIFVSIVFASETSCQVIVPYYEGFDDLSFLTKNGGLWKDQVKKSVENPRLQISEGKLELTVEAYDTIAMDTRSNRQKIRNRAEIFIRPRHPAGSQYYYSWFFKIPDEDRWFVDDRLSDQNGFHIIAQWHEESHFQYDCSRTQPPIKISYKHSNEKNNVRSLGVSYGLKCNDKFAPWDSQSNHLINPAISKGEWIHLVVLVNWSSGDDGFLQMWINGVPAILNGRYSKLDTLNHHPSKLMGANMYPRSEDLRPIPNYLKLGHYRGTHDTKSTIYFDDFRISEEFPPSYKETKLMNCQNEYKIGTGEIACYPVTGINFYEFKIRDIASGAIQTVRTSENAISINEHFDMEQGKSYSASVRTSLQVEYSDEKTFEIK